MYIGLFKYLINIYLFIFIIIIIIIIFNNIPNQHFIYIL